MATGFDPNSDLIMGFEDEDYRIKTSSKFLKQGYKPLFIPENSRPQFISYKFNESKDLYELFVPIVFEEGFIGNIESLNSEDLVYSNLLLNLQKGYEMTLKDVTNKRNGFFTSHERINTFDSKDMSSIINHNDHYMAKKKGNELFYLGHGYNLDNLRINLVDKDTIPKSQRMKGHELFSFYDIAFSILNPESKENVFFVNKNRISNQKECLERIISNF